jgi:hypothetical protein
VASPESAHRIHSPGRRVHRPPFRQKLKRNADFVSSKTLIHCGAAPPHTRGAEEGPARIVVSDWCVTLSNGLGMIGGPPSVLAFRSVASRVRGFEAAQPVWHLHDWVWHDRSPGQDSRGSALDTYRKSLLLACPALGRFAMLPAPASTVSGLGA